VCESEEKCFFLTEVTKHTGGRRAGVKEIFNPGNPIIPMFFIFFYYKKIMIRKPGKQENVLAVIDCMLHSWLHGFLRVKSIKRGVV
jgi:hypothetical protein